MPTKPMKNHNENTDMVFISVYSDIHCYNIRRLSAYLKKNGLTSKIIFLPQPSNKRYSQKILDQVIKLCSDTKLIGFSFTSNYFDNTEQVTNAVKKLNVPIIWGGAPNNHARRMSGHGGFGMCR